MNKKGIAPILLVLIFASIVLLILFLIPGIVLSFAVADVIRNPVVWILVAVIIIAWIFKDKLTGGKRR